MDDVLPSMGSSLYDTGSDAVKATSIANKMQRGEDYGLELLEWQFDVCAFLPGRGPG